MKVFTGTGRDCKREIQRFIALRFWHRIWIGQLDVLIIADPSDFLTKHCFWWRLNHRCLLPTLKSTSTHVGSFRQLYNRFLPDLHVSILFYFSLLVFWSLSSQTPKRFVEFRKWDIGTDAIALGLLSHFASGTGLHLDIE